MTMHFAFFLLDVSIWLVMGFFLGRILDITESVAKRKRGRNGLFLMGIAFLSGCWSVLTRGLPDQGISFHSILMVASAIVGISLLKAPHFRKEMKVQLDNTTIYFAKVLQQVERLKSITSTPKF